ncbi:MAG: hypothetical protein A3F35_00570 [Candidatus Woykebacteria bacterium RIFCSPHIGHO2_12_FULL_45_10]|uniref:Uncharacterized protein n=1 Tax=Candidatus Woykebacteria bacterium RIFCSPHIGHO2_12_FULL_45_10 TaxID=1802603 RepID=A0A1G1WQM6_9BACT|nr:MAG: hypothetical protein A3F35_00570 [Candidatus Woykebacteria bacterium RIFCSPHIGHO2_12_FULL_45_10]
MNERLIVDVYFSDKNGLLPDAIGDLFPGTIDEWGDITVCGNSYIGFGGIKTDFIDKKGEEHSIRDVLVKLEDFAKIVRALSDNEVEISRPEAEHKPASSYSAELQDLLS